MENIRILAIYAHPADVATEAAGTVAIHADLGDEVTGVVLSDGLRFHPHFFYQMGPEGESSAPGRVMEDEIREFKRAEVRRAAEILGIREVVFMGWNDNFSDATDARAQELAEVILRVRPDVVLTHLPAGPVHLDQNAFAGVHALRGLDRAASMIRQLDGVDAHHVKEIFFWCMDQTADTRYKAGTEGLVADVYIDITGVVDRKVRALDQFVSQGYEGSFARKVVEARDGRYGMHANTSYAEPFIVHRGTTYASLPLPESVRNRKYVPNDLPGDQLLAVNIPLAVRPEYYRFRR